MKIIDAHIHFYDDENGHFNQLAQNIGDVNSEEYLRNHFKKYNIEKAIVMGNRGTDPQTNVYPDFLVYAVGINQMYKEILVLDQTLEMVEENLKKDSCVGIKLYPGYTHEYIHEEHYFPLYQLAAKYNKAVAIHTGLTARSSGVLKYSHPLIVDEIAAKFPDTRFVMCHFGYPWLVDAVAVLEKNPNVFCDLSGLLEGNYDAAQFVIDKKEFFEEIRKWLNIMDNYKKFMYGTDWPLAKMEFYIEFVKRLIPQEHWEAVFYDNAKEIYTMK